MAIYNASSDARLGVTENLYVPYELTDSWPVMVTVDGRLEDRLGPDLPSVRFFSRENIVPDGVKVEASADELQKLGRTGLSNILMQFDMEDGAYPPGVEFARKIEKVEIDGIGIYPHHIIVANTKAEKCIPALAALYGSFLLFGVRPKKVVPIEADFSRNQYGKIFGFDF